MLYFTFIRLYFVSDFFFFSVVCTGFPLTVSDNFSNLSKSIYQKKLWVLQGACDPSKTGFVIKFFQALSSLIH